MENIDSLCQPNLEEVSIQLEHWRKTKKSIYEPILKKAVGASSRTCSIYCRMK